MEPWLALNSKKGCPSFTFLGSLALSFFAYTFLLSLFPSLFPFPLSPSCLLSVWLHFVIPSRFTHRKGSPTCVDMPLYGSRRRAPISLIQFLSLALTLQALLAVFLYSFASACMDCSGSVISHSSQL